MSSGDPPGFELRADFTYGGGIRWIEVAPAGAANAIALVGPGEGGPAGGDRTYIEAAQGEVDGGVRHRPPYVRFFSHSCAWR